MKGNAVRRDHFNVYRTADSSGYVVEDSYVAEAGNASSVLVLTPSGASVKTGVNARSLALQGTDPFEICAVVGVIELVLGKYVVVATARTLAATVQSHKIWRITAANLLPLGAGAVHGQLSPRNVDEKTLAKYTLDHELLQSVNEIVNSGHLYFSTTYDLTHSIQHNQLKAAGQASRTVVDDRYFFTRALAKPLLDVGKDAEPWVIRAISGFAGTIDLKVKLPESDIPAIYKLTLLSRLNGRRMGTRYVRRGLDFEGNTANNVEMEQILFHEDYINRKKISTFVQIRGSVPSVWGQDLNLDYKPELLIASIDKTVVWNSCKKHYDDLKRQYIGEDTFIQGGSDVGKVVCVNLLDVTGFEGRLTKVYEDSVKRFMDEKVVYEAFPVNKWCKGAKYENMDILLDRVRHRLVSSGWFIADGAVPTLATKGSLEVSKLQTGLARVSCLDSLDRTNLTCSIFARYMLAYQLQTISPDLPPLPVGQDGVIASDLVDPVAVARQALEPSRQILTNMWADSGDAISLLYAGTGALKADVTRTGRKTLKGSLNDGINSLTRFYLNNFVDGRRQDAYDLITGKAVPTQIEKLIDTEGLKRAQRVRQPFIAKGQGILGRLLPTMVVNNVEPLLQTTNDYVQFNILGRRPTINGTGPAPPSGKTGQDPPNPRWISPHVDSQGSARSLAGLAVSVVKLYAPEHVNNAVEFVVALCVIWYLYLIAKITGIQGQLVVNRPKLSVEYRNIFELLD
ncbi:Sac phosphatase domain-containing protein [Fimicolochytrium jonesii]|uniref:Sac phosphatase domain-containing protein n=1 Tax=Fimicolochytrium jonesii TaxID=1396493 RepID=UPI0022FE8CAD|nr:Sac phosphatase domain-containing protein [Fimicolochytrium jonesii]KAI8826757.1 SacI homology domain-containing protein [Fimicolochytrium jonesii]